MLMAACWSSSPELNVEHVTSAKRGVWSVEWGGLATVGYSEVTLACWISTVKLVWCKARPSGEIKIHKKSYKICMRHENCFPHQQTKQFYSVIYFTPCTTSCFGNLFSNKAPTADWPLRITRGIRILYPSFFSALKGLFHIYVWYVL